MKKVVGVRMRHVGDIVYIDPADTTFDLQEKVIVEREGNLYTGSVVLTNKEVDDEKIKEYTAKFIRRMTDADEETLSNIRIKEEEGKATCNKLIKKNGLEMKLIDCEYSFDEKKVLFNFTADDRVDFRNLVKDLAAQFKARIELRQIGVRDEARIVGGLGCCGRPLCCKTYLTEFAPTSIKMAKDQNLSLNPTKISGICGRLMCCLNNEEETYQFLNKDMPYAGDEVQTPDDLHGVVQSTNILRQTAKIIVDLPGDEKDLREYQAHDLKITKRKRKGCQNQNQDKDQEKSQDVQ